MLRQAKLLKGCGIYITEDISAKNGKKRIKTCGIHGHEIIP